jgi:hypothetical protein
MKRTFYKITLGLLATASTTFAQVPTNGLVAHYPFNGNANDASGNGYTGTVNGATLVNDRFGNANSAYDFDGNGQHIILTNTASQNLLTGFSLVSWIKSTSPAGSFISKHKNYYRNTFAFGFNDGHAVVSTDVVAYVVGTPQKYNDGKWHLIVGVYNGTTLLIYADGVLAGSMSANYTTANTENIKIGRDSDLSFYKGTLDDIRIYNRAITPNEVATLFNEDNAVTSISNSNNINDTSIKIYPNPTSDNIIIENALGANALFVTDALGQTVFSSAIKQDQLRINLVNWKKGLYVVKMLDAQNAVVATSKVIVQ